MREEREEEEKKEEKNVNQRGVKLRMCVRVSVYVRERESSKNACERVEMRK